MASTPSQNNALELIGTGEKTGTWGVITNDNLTIIDRATKGVGTITLATTSYSLDTVDYTPSEGHYAVLVFAGAPGGTCTVTINPNDQQKLFIIRNTTPSSVVLTQGSGGNVTVATGRSAVVYATGTGSVAAVVDITSLLSLNLSTVSLTGTLAQFNTALSDGDFATTANAQTLTNKTIDLSSNTLTGTTAQFNAALSDGNFATQAGSETLTNKTFNLASNTLTGTLAQFNAALSDEEFMSLAGGETVLNKSISLGSNTITGTIAQFNTALTDGDFATIAGTETLTNKSLTTPTLTGAPYVNGSYRSNITAVAALDIDCSAGNYFTKSISSNSTFTFSNVPSSRAFGFVLRLSITGTPTITWPASVLWPDGLEPSWSSGAVNLYVFTTDNGGSVWRGAALTDYAG